MKKRIGIVFADEMEYKPFSEIALQHGAKEEKLCGCNSVSFDFKGNTVTATESGIGKVNAALATAALILEKKAEIILNAGLSGAISGLRRGDIVAGETFVECDFDLGAIGYELGKKPDGDISLHRANKALLEKLLRDASIKSGNFGTGDLFLTDSEKKALFKEKFEICAFDMETAAIAAVCDKCEIPFLSVRKISDDADDSSIEDYREMNDRAEAHLSEILLKFLENI